MSWDDLTSTLERIWPQLAAVVTLAVNLLISAHLVMYKRDSRSAIAWMGMVWLVPVLGPILYFILGINRVQRKAVRVRGRSAPGYVPPTLYSCRRELLLETLTEKVSHLAALDKLVGELTERPLLRGNRILPLLGGDAAYDEMLAAIDAAQTSITLSTYIFDNDQSGGQFVEALGRAVKRGVAARVLIDDIGARYSWPSIDGPLRAAGVKTARFFPTLVPGWFAYANLRNHRKILVVDGRIGFTGGLNIRDGYSLRVQGSEASRYWIKDLHFRLDGPVVAHLQEVFVDDWEFSTGESLRGDVWFPEVQPAGASLARGISAGPDSDLDKLRLTLLGAIASAETSIAIVTPYFLPDSSLITALNVAALCGIEVDIFLPQQNNLALVKWASMAMLWQLLERGCRIWMTEPPFDHSKLMIVDGAWTLLGSGNWDPRSLRLNFEFNVECYDPEFAGQMTAILTRLRKRSRRITLEEVDGRSLPARLRDGLARLLTPYL